MQPTRTLGAFARAPGLALDPCRLRSVAGEAIDAFVFRVPGVALDPLPRDLVRRGRRDQFVPKIFIADRLLARVEPALLLPSGNPLRHPVDDVAAVGMDGDLARLDQRLEAADHGGHLHPIVGRVRLASAQLLFVLAHSQQRRPATRSWIALAGAVGENIDAFHAFVMTWPLGKENAFAPSVA